MMSRLRFLSVLCRGFLLVIDSSGLFDIMNIVWIGCFLFWIVCVISVFGRLLCCSWLNEVF